MNEFTTSKISVECDRCAMRCRSFTVLRSRTGHARFVLCAACVRYLAMQLDSEIDPVNASVAARVIDDFLFSGAKR